MPRELPHASLDWADYTLTDPERLVFIINALAERVITSLEERGESARELALVLSLANREQSLHRVRFTRPTASRKIWMRQIRAMLERITLGDAITGVLLRVDALAAKRSPQGISSTAASPPRARRSRRWPSSSTIRARSCSLPNARGTCYSIDGRVGLPRVRQHSSSEAEARWARGVRPLSPTSRCSSFRSHNPSWSSRANAETITSPFATAMAHTGTSWKRCQGRTEHQVANGREGTRASTSGESGRWCSRLVFRDAIDETGFFTGFGTDEGAQSAQVVRSQGKRLRT